jgi:predicted enzyme related to lactoylglutathione lyase
MGPDPAALVAFYSELFGWTSKKYEIPGIEYYEMNTGADGGIQGGIGSNPMGAVYATVYASPPDIEATAQRAEQLGGKVIMPATKMPDAGTIAMFTDPQGHIFGLHRQG